MPNNSNIPDFRQRRRHGKCPACAHVGSDCKCHKNPNEAAAIYVQRQIEAALTSIATARAVAIKYKLKSFAELDLLPAEIGNTYLDRRDRFVVSLVAGFGTDDHVSSPEEAVRAALGFITEDDGAAATHWYCFDRDAGVLHRIEQGDAEAPGE